MYLANSIKDANMQHFPIKASNFQIIFKLEMTHRNVAVKVLLVFLISI